MLSFEFSVRTLTLPEATKKEKKEKEERRKKKKVIKKIISPVMLVADLHDTQAPHFWLENMV